MKKFIIIAFVFVLMFSTIAMAETRIVSEGHDTYTEDTTQILCKSMGNEIEITREVSEYQLNTTTGNKTYSVISLHIKNSQNLSLENVQIEEKIPIKLTGNLVDFVEAPEKSNLVNDSLIAVWALDKLDPGEEKVISYGVQNKITKEVIANFQSPAVKAQEVAVKQELMPLGTLIAIAALIVILIVEGVIYVKVRRK